MQATWVGLLTLGDVLTDRTVVGRRDCWSVAMPGRMTVVANLMRTARQRAVRREVRMTAPRKQVQALAGHRENHKKCGKQMCCKPLLLHHTCIREGIAKRYQAKAGRPAVFVSPVLTCVRRQK